MTNTTRRNQPLYRDPNDKMIGGVCSSLGRYLNVDTILIRVGFVVLALLGGGGVLAYLILWAVLDPAPPEALIAQGGTETPTVAASDAETLLEDLDEASHGSPAAEESQNDES